MTIITTTPPPNCTANHQHHNITNLTHTTSMMHDNDLNTFNSIANTNTDITAYLVTDTSSDIATDNATTNIYANKYRPVVVPWLSDSAFANSSATAWYLMRDPAKYASMVVSFLDGVEQPTVESAEADFDTLGIDFRGYHDFGCDHAEYNAGIKSKGAA